MKKIKLLTAICLMVSFTTIRANDFDKGGIIYDITSSTTLKAVGTSSDMGYIKIPDSIVYRDRTFRVTEIGREAFANLHSITRIKMPESVTKIGERPFGGGPNCTEVVLSSKLRELPEGCFTGFSSLKSIKLPDSLRVIGNNALSGCSGLTSITIPEGVTEIGPAAFKGCKGLTKLVLPANVEKIRYNAFEACEKLTSVTIQSTSVVIESEAFARCQLLKEVKLLGKVSGIGYKAFYNCKALEELTLPDGIMEIGSEVFYNCTNLRHINLPNSITTIGRGAFMYCENLEEVNLPLGIDIILMDMFNGCKKIQTLTVPENVNDIGGGAIAGCTSLKQLIMRPQDVIYITEDRFSEENYNNVELVIPAGMLQQYQEAEGWKNFKTISEQEVTDRQIIATLHVDPFGTVKVNGQVYESGSWAITLPAGKRVKFEIVPDETHLISRAEHQYYGGIDQFSEEVKGGALTIKNVSNGDSFRFFFENGHADIDILQTDKGKVTIHARKNQRYRYMVTPEEGWQINSITWNGEDMTDQMKTNAFIETPIVTANSILQVAVEKSSSAIASSSVSRLKVHAIGDCLYIENVDQGESVGIYGADGTLMKTLTGNGFTLSTTLKRGHVYIIQTKQKTVKILL